MAIDLLTTGRVAGWLLIDRGYEIAVREAGATRRANNRVFQISTDVSEGYRVAGTLLVLECPLLNSAVNLAQVINAGVLLSRSTCSDEVGDRNRREQADNGHHDHDLHQRETAFAGCSVFHFLLWFVTA